MQNQQQNFTVVIGHQKIITPKKITLFSTFLHNIHSLGFEQQQIYLQQEMIQVSTFKSFIQFVKINNFQEPKIAKPIKTNNLEEVLNNVNFQFMKKFPIRSNQFKKLIKAGSFLGSKALLSVCAAPVACLIYFEDSKIAFENKCKQLGIEQKVQFHDQQKFKKIYPFMNTEVMSQQNHFCK